eukprot:351377-Chlamydomonas_euryale.AAC.4
MSYMTVHVTHRMPHTTPHTPRLACPTPPRTTATHPGMTATPASNDGHPPWHDGHARLALLLPQPRQDEVAQRQRRRLRPRGRHERLQRRLVVRIHLFLRQDSGF